MESERYRAAFTWLDELGRTPLPVDTVPRELHGADNIEWHVLRADSIHPVFSGNKFYKLRLYLQDALQKNHTILLTEGGPWSNHLVATAFAANRCGLASIGIVNGWPLRTPSATLEEAADLGMKLVFRQGRSLRECMGSVGCTEAYHIPAGGAGTAGVRGASGMLQHVQTGSYSHIICAVGTGTMLAGLMLAALPGGPTPSQSQRTEGTLHGGVYGVSVLLHADLEKDVAALLEPIGDFPQPVILHGYEEGGYARTSEELISFMNQFYEASGIPTDLVYTGKLMRAVQQMIRQNAFPPGSRILTIHSGGLQGNRSLKKGKLIF